MKTNKLYKNLLTQNKIIMINYIVKELKLNKLYLNKLPNEFILIRKMGNKRDLLFLIIIAEKSYINNINK